MVNPIYKCNPCRKLKTGLGNWILKFGIYLSFGACILLFPVYPDWGFMTSYRNLVVDLVNP